MKERRLYPRFDVVLPAQMWVEGEPLDGNIFNLSMGGVQLGCDYAAVARAVPTTGQIVSPGQNLTVRLSFQLPNERMGLNAECRIAACRRVSDNEYRVGLELLEFGSEEESQQYEHYIDSRMSEVA